MSQAQEKNRRRLPHRRLILALSGAAAVLLCALLCYLIPPRALLPAAPIPARAEGELRLHFLGVGQGDCTVAEFADGELLVIDGGSGAYFTENKIVRYLKGLHPRRISLLLTHADIDHYGGFKDLFAAFDVAACYLPAIPMAENKRYGELLAAAEKEGCEIGTLSRYDAIEGAGGYLVCISPRSSEEENIEENDASTVLYCDLGGVTALLCGDISARREKLLVREYSLLEGIFDSGGHAVRLENINILKTSHHGSEDASSEEFLRLLCPEVGVLSCGRDNSYKHPAAEALARFRACSPEGKIYRTDELGDVIVSIKDAGYTVTVR